MTGWHPVSRAEAGDLLRVLRDRCDYEVRLMPGRCVTAVMLYGALDGSTMLALRLGVDGASSREWWVYAVPADATERFLAHVQAHGPVGPVGS